MATCANAHTIAHTAVVVVHMRMRIPLPTRVGPVYKEIAKKELGAAEFGYVKNVAGLRFEKGRSVALKHSERDVRRIFDLRNHCLSRPRATTASDAGRRTRAVFLPWLLVARAGLGNN